MTNYFSKLANLISDIEEIKSDWIENLLSKKSSRRRNKINLLILDELFAAQQLLRFHSVKSSSKDLELPGITVQHMNRLFNFHDTDWAKELGKQKNWANA